jgi:hypothetical protein
MADINLVDVQYVGRKPVAFDNVAGSKKQWDGNGDVQTVTEAQARILIKYPDQWALVNRADEATVTAPVTLTATDPEGNQVIVSEADLKKPVEKMNKTELTVYAKEKFNKDLDPALSKKLMLDQLEQWEKEIDPSGLV